MSNPTATMAQQVAEAARDYQVARTGHAPTAVSVILTGDTLVITLHGALTPAEQKLSAQPEGAAQVQEFHRQLFAASNDALRNQIKQITGVEVREAAGEVETATGSVVHVFTGGTMVQVFLLAKDVEPGTWPTTELAKRAPADGVPGTPPPIPPPPPPLPMDA